MKQSIIEQGDTETRHGKIHWQTWSEESQSPADLTGNPLVCLHPMPHSGQFFEVIAPFLTAGRTVIAPDYPSYGGSDELAGEPTIGIYAESMIETLRQLACSGPFDLFGFHTGCLVAVELSLGFGEEIGKLALVDVPFFDAVKCQELLKSDIAKGGFVAAFKYPSEERFPRVKHDTLVIATESSLLEPSRLAAAQIEGCELREQREITAPALENGAQIISKATLEFLDG